MRVNNDDEVAESQGHERVQPVNIRFSVACEVNPSDPQKPVCHIKYATPGLFGSSTVEEELDMSATENEIDNEDDEIDGEDGAHSVTESKGKSLKEKKKSHPKDLPKTHSKKSIKSEEDDSDFDSDDDEEGVDDDEEEDDDSESDEDEDILECVQKSTMTKR